MREKLLIVGNFGKTHLGGSFLRAAQELGYNVNTANARNAYDAGKLRSHFSWRIMGKRPPRLGEFSRSVLSMCQEQRPQILLSTGMAPILADDLRAIRAMGTIAVDFLTDDPWNPAHRSDWFLSALAQYDLVASPRLSNIADLIGAGCRKVVHIRFGYDPALFFPPGDAPNLDDEVAEIAFVGGGDADRIKYFEALARAGFNLDLYGGYWDRNPVTRRYHRGFADIATARHVLAHTKINLCLVRRANRDGHCMRTYEIPAVGGFMMLEDTREHREIFGRDHDFMVYFTSVEDAVAKAAEVIKDPVRIRRSAEYTHKLIVGGHNTYLARLRKIMKELYSS